MVEYMDGGSLQQICDQGGLTDEAVLASLCGQAARGLRYLHATRHVHRDLKPANMLINRRGELKLSDFGIVRRLEDPAAPAAAADDFVDPAARLLAESTRGRRGNLSRSAVREIEPRRGAATE